ncbi:ABC transporter permease [Asanoa sp. WMMD1127]|uniref:ABC transporter permease n=1 Tax=Asanoa sp. WMMD1127 TaxID=3016107 RepID=UPI0024163F81|nr:ABC transporter permease [Asanoa sp. WMMD1127]MDG4822771.1 ABC transporter permease [Asanoa sp. WMMD1127]
MTEQTTATAEDLAAAGADQLPPPKTFAGRYLRALWTANTFTVTVLAVLLALVIGGILIAVSDENVRATFSYFFSRPSDFFSLSWDKVSDAYAQLFKGSIVDPEAVTAAANGTGPWERVFFPISETLTYAAPLALTGLAFALAFRGGLFNIGVQGQAIMGAVGAALAGFLLPLPVGIHLIVALIAGAAFGGAYGFVPGFLKARTGAHEVITTIMLNYVALFFLGWLIIQKGIQDPERSDAISKPVDESAQLTHLLGFLGPSLRVNLGIVVAILVVAAIAWMLRRSTFGFELRAVGLNPEASRTAGIGVGSTYAMVMTVAGALAGLGGATIVMGTAVSLTGAVIGSVGFDGLLVGLLGRAKPWGVFFAALLFGALQAGGNRMQSFSGISLELVSVIQALIVIFVAAPALVKTVFRLRPAKVSGLGTGMSKGW